MLLCWPAAFGGVAPPPPDSAPKGDRRGRGRGRLGTVHPLESDDAYTWQYLSGGHAGTPVDGVQLYQLSYAAAHNYARVVGAPRRAQEA